jgi:hypothetical protein
LPAAPLIDDIGGVPALGAIAFGEVVLGVVVLGVVVSGVVVLGLRPLLGVVLGLVVSGGVVVLGLVVLGLVVLGDVVVLGGVAGVDGTSFVTRVRGTTSPVDVDVRGARVVSRVVGCWADAAPATPATSAAARAAASRDFRPLRICISSARVPCVVRLAGAARSPRAGDVRVRGLLTSASGRGCDLRHDSGRDQITARTTPAPASPRPARPTTPASP